MLFLLAFFLHFLGSFHLVCLLCILCLLRFLQFQFLHWLFHILDRFCLLVPFLILLLHQWISVGWRTDKWKCSFCVWAFIATSQQGVSILHHKNFQYYCSTLAALHWKTMFYSGLYLHLCCTIMMQPAILYDVIESHNRTL